MIGSLGFDLTLFDQWYSCSQLQRYLLCSKFGSALDGVWFANSMSCGFNHGWLSCVFE